MKRIVSVVCALLIFSTAFSQDSLKLTTDKTTCIVFPFTIVHVDKGTRDVLVQTVKETGNVLLAKAACIDFHPTNLSVLTADGSLYSFIVYYDNSAVQFVYKAPVQVKTSIETYARNLLTRPPFLHRPRDQRWGVQALVSGIYIKDHVLYVQLLFTNRSPLDYDIDFLHVYIRDKRKVKRTASQEIELKPIYKAGNSSTIRSFGATVIVLALEQFTIPEGKWFVIEVSEKNGGRNLLLKAGNRKIVRAKLLPDIQ
ncbi:MAG: DUF4138 domain-containing protein [Chitinophagaceae bacterium]